MDETIQWSECRGAIQVATIFAWRKTAEKSPLRKWLVDAICRTLTADRLEADDNDFPIDLMQALLVAKLRGVDGVNKTDKCAYHVHEQGQHCD